MRARLGIDPRTKFCPRVRNEYKDKNPRHYFCPTDPFENLSKFAPSIRKRWIFVQIWGDDSCRRGWWPRVMAGYDGGTVEMIVCVCSHGSSRSSKIIVTSSKNKSRSRNRQHDAILHCMWYRYLPLRFQGLVSPPPANLSKPWSWGSLSSDRGWLWTSFRVGRISKEIRRRIWIRYKE